MSAPTQGERGSTPLKELSTTLAGMEDSAMNLVRWARAIQDLGTIDGEVSAEGLYAIGNAMADDARVVLDGWKQSFDLMRYMRESDR